jgi:succinoglycan biosynthesis transport protein ExoP
VVTGQTEDERTGRTGLHAPARNPVTLRDILVPVFFFKRRAIIAFLIPVVLAFLAAAVAKPTYVAESRLLILLGDDYVVRNPLSGMAPGMSFDRAQIVNAETEILQSREIAMDTLRAVGVEKVYPGTHGARALETAAETFQKDLATENIPQSNVIRITLRNGDSEVAAEALNKLIEFYMVRRRAIFDQSNTASLDRQAVIARQQLDQIETQVAGLSAQRGFGDYEAELKAVQDQRNALVAQIDVANQQLAQKAGQAGQLARRGSETPQSVELSVDRQRSQQVSSLTENLLSLQNQRREAANTYNAGNAIIVELDDRIAKLQRELATAPRDNVQTTRTGVNTVREEIDKQQVNSEAEAAGARQGRGALNEALAQTNKRLADLTEIGPTFRTLLRNRAALEAEVVDLAKQSQTSKLANNLSRARANVRVIQAAKPPIQGHTGRAFLLLAGIAVGVMAAAGTTIISVAVFQGMTTANDIEQKLALPVVLTLNDTEPSQRPTEHGLPWPAFMSRDELKVLSHFLRSVAPGQNCALQLIGATEGVGVTSILVDIAVLSAREGKSVLLVDFESRSGEAAIDKLTARGAVLHDLDPTSGVVRVGESQLHVTRPIGSLELTMGEMEWARLLRQACEEYNLVLIDSPPLSRSWTGIFVAPAAAATLAVVAAETTRAPSALNLIERITGGGGVVQAAIFNRRRFYIPRRVLNWL